jgi:hypothetical protein
LGSGQLYFTEHASPSTQARGELHSDIDRGDMDRGKDNDRSENSYNRETYRSDFYSTGCGKYTGYGEFHTITTTGDHTAHRGVNCYSVGRCSNN